MPLQLRQLSAMQREAELAGCKHVARHRRTVRSKAFQLEHFPSFRRLFEILASAGLLTAAKIRLKAASG
jgi:hypothetical protein